MSHGVFGWRAKATGLGLILSVFILSGATCLPDLSDVTGGSSNNGGNTAAQATPITLTVLSPLSDVVIQAGTVVQISWTSFTNGQTGQLKVFYDTDNNVNNGVRALTLIDTSSPVAPTRYTWDTTGVANGTYYLGAQLTIGTTAVTSYAIGRVTITSTSTGVQYSLDQLGSTFKGCVFEGFSFAGRLGSAMAGRFDMLSDTGAPDGVSDFVLLATNADSHYEEDPEVGEAYIIYGWDGRRGMRSAGWYNGGHFNVNAIGTDRNLPGTIVVGPAYITSSLGIVAVQPIPDVDGDGGAELMFGTPLLVNGRYEDQDYDPCDNPPGCYFNAPYAYPLCRTTQNPDDHDFYGGLVWSSGYITVLASTTPGLYTTATGLGGVVHIDEIGQVDAEHDAHPRTIDPAIGLRLYPQARQEAWSDFLQNDVRFGAQIGIEDVDGDGSPDWLIASPNSNFEVGEVQVSFTSQALLWTSALPATASCYSWPYFLCTGDRTPIWPGVFMDRVRGDELNAPQGQLGNPTGLGDFNGDGLGDFAVSTPKASNGLLANAGAAYLIYGRAPFGDHAVSDIKNPVILNAMPGVMISGTAAGDRLGEKMACLGHKNYAMPGAPALRDFNADGRPDLVITAPGRSIPGKSDVGAIAIVFGNGRLDGRFTWDQIGTADLPGIIITGSNQGDEFGAYIAEAGDINGDGSDDLIVAAPGAENPLTGAQDAGAIYVIYGPPSSGAELNKYQALSGTYSVEDLMANGPIKVRAYYGAIQGHRIGPVAGAGDIDNDGYEDILVGDPAAAPLGRTDAGEVFLIFGSQY